MLNRIYVKIGLVLVGLVLLIAGCQFFKNLLSKETLSNFPHKTHLDAGLDCKTCHTEYEKQNVAGMPTSLKDCMTCHEGIDKDKPPEKKITKFEKDGKPLWARVTDISDEIKFSHKVHFDKKVACEECHKGIKESIGLNADLKIDMDLCFKCHSTKVDCATCHKEITKNTAPQTHKENWKGVHGQIVKANATSKSINRCSLCHVESECIKCHRDEAPKDHNAFWRHTGHGITANIDRTRCTTCHQVDFCVRCHSETSPRSHKGGWGGPLNQHCLSCHLPRATENCSICHRTILHSSAPDKPNNVEHTSSNCRGCHTVVPHLDNGDNCNNCHK